MADECFEFNVIADSDWNCRDSVQAYYKHSENIADLLTSLLVFSEEELLKAQSAGDFDFSSCMSKDQVSLALFYCQNHKVLAENFMKNIVPKIMAQNKRTESQRRIKISSRQKRIHSSDV